MDADHYGQALLPYREPYGEWLDGALIELKDLKIPNVSVKTYTKEECKRLQKAFGYTYEDVRTTILPMAVKGGEGISSMGIDVPLAKPNSSAQRIAAIATSRPLINLPSVSIRTRSRSPFCSSV